MNIEDLMNDELLNKQIQEQDTKIENVMLQIPCIPEVLKIGTIQCLLATEQQNEKIFSEWGLERQYFSGMLGNYETLYQKYTEPLLQYQDTLQEIALHFNTENYKKRYLRSIFLQNYWAIMDEELINKLLSLTETDKKRVEGEILAYYTDNNFEKLINIFEKYADDPEIVSRKFIFTSCFEIMNKLPIEIASQAVIPTLLAQMSFFYETLYGLLPLSTKNELKEKIKQDENLLCPLCNDKKPKECKFVNPPNPHINRKVFLQHLEQTMALFAYYYYKDIISETFNNGHKITRSQKKEDQKFTMYRSKVLHGEELQYGSMENLIRCWLELAFLFELRKIYRNYFEDRHSSSN